MAQKKKRPSRIPFYILAVVFVSSSMFIFNANIHHFDDKEILARDLKNQFHMIEKDFNNVTPGWKYDEYCIGYSTKQFRKNSKTCYVTLANDMDSSKDSFNTYLGLLKNTYKLKLVYPVGIAEESVNFNKTVRLSKLSNPLNRDLGCRLSDISYVSAEESGYYFDCSFSSRDYYFMQREINSEE